MLSRLRPGRALPILSAIPTSILGFPRGLPRPEHGEFCRQLCNSLFQNRQLSGILALFHLWAPLGFHSFQYVLHGFSRKIGNASCTCGDTHLLKGEKFLFRKADADGARPWLENSHLEFGSQVWIGQAAVTECSARTLEGNPEQASPPSVPKGILIYYAIYISP